MKMVRVVLCDCNQTIDTIEIEEGYTEHDYIDDCEINGVDVSGLYSDFYTNGLNIKFVDVED